MVPSSGTLEISNGAGQSGTGNSECSADAGEHVTADAHDGHWGWVL